MIPRDVYASIPAATSFADVPFDRWRELNADGVVVGTVQKIDDRRQGRGAAVQRAQPRQSAFGQEYTGVARPTRGSTRTRSSDEIHQQQRALRGVARTKLTFNSDRDGERMTGTVENRGVKEIYIADYDGENQRRVTTNGSLNIISAWSPDGRSIAYTSYRRGHAEHLHLEHLSGHARRADQGRAARTGCRSGRPTARASRSRRRATATSEIYVVNRDGSNVRRLTNHPGIDTTPTWSPSGTQIAFTSDRTGTPQIYVMGADGLGQRSASRRPRATPTGRPGRRRRTTRSRTPRAPDRATTSR